MNPFNGLFPPATSTTLADNLRWFATIYVLGTIGAMIALGALSQIGINVPGPGVGAGLFFGIVALSTQRLAKQRDITKQERGKLALGYVLLALAISIVLIALMLAAALALVGPHMLAQMIPLDAGALGFVAIALIVVSLIYFVGARFVVGMVAARTKRALNS